jgi:ubiquinone/menaquinone biosynthesis C-methylase UbiE
MTDAAYDAIAAWYDDALRRGALLHEMILAALPDLIGEIAGQRVCDLACGQGVVARELARRGARVTGIDLSAGLLDLARGDEATAPLGITYRRGDAHHLPEIPEAAFDGLVCCMALMDIPDLAAAAGTIRRVVRPGGWVAIVTTHPCFETPDAWWAADEAGLPYRAVRAYLDEGFWRSGNPDGVRGKVGAYHRTLGTLLTTLAAADLALERLDEPRGRTIVPPLLLARLRRAAAAGTSR